MQTTSFTDRFRLEAADAVSSSCVFDHVAMVDAIGSVPALAGRLMR